MDRERHNPAAGRAQLGLGDRAEHGRDERGLDVGFGHAPRGELRGRSTRGGGRKR
jgi:hypothetical protein